MSDAVTNATSALTTTTSTNADTLPIVSTPLYAKAGILTTDPAYLGIPDVPALGSHVLTVGAGGQYSTLSAAIAAAQNGDVIAINARGGITLTNDFAKITQKSLTIEGVGGIVNMVATVPPPNQKGILVIDAAEGGNITIKNMSFSGVAISDASGGNGAGIRYDTGNLNVINCNFSNNQNGILANPDSTGNITIDHSTFSNNGSGTGSTHDIYIGDIANFTLSNSIVSSAIVGHEVKSRASNNTITNNVIQDGPTGTGSYDIDIPNGGNTVISGNYIEKGPNAENHIMIAYGEEGSVYSNSSLTINNNNFVDDEALQAIAVNNATLVTATISNNTFNNVTASNLVHGAATLTGNVNGDGTAIANTSQAALTSGPGVFVFADSIAHTLSFTSYGEAAQGGAGLMTITSNWGHETVYGGSGGLIYTDTGPVAAEWSDNIVTAAGSSNIISVIGGDTIASAGTDTISLGAGNSSVVVTGTATISGGSGAEVFQVQSGGSLTLSVATGSSNTLNVLSGSTATVTGDTVYLGGQWLGGNLSYAITEGGQAINGSIVGGSGQISIWQGVTSITMAASLTGSIVTLGAGNAQVISVGPDIIHAGSGSDTIIVSANATVYAGSGQLAVYGHGESGVATIYGNGGSTLIDGDSGGIKYVGNNLAATVIDNLSNTEIDGGMGFMTILGGGYNRTINGGAGGIDVVNASGGDTITTAAGSANLISLGYACTIISNGTDQITCSNGNMTLTANGNATITGSQGNCLYNLNGTDILTSYGSDNINVGANAAVTDTATGGVVTVNNNGGLIHLNEINGHDAVSVSLSGSGWMQAWGGSNSATINTVAGKSAVVTLSSGNNLVHSYGTDTIQTGTGNDTIWDSGNGDVIIISAAQLPRTITINNFNAAHDILELTGFSHGFAVASEHLISNGVAVSLTDGSVIDFTGQNNTTAVLIGIYSLHTSG